MSKYKLTHYVHNMCECTYVRTSMYVCMYVVCKSVRKGLSHCLLLVKIVLHFMGIVNNIRHAVVKTNRCLFKFTLSLVLLLLALIYTFSRDFPSSCCCTLTIWFGLMRKMMTTIFFLLLLFVSSFVFYLNCGCGRCVDEYYVNSGGEWTLLKFL